MFSVKKFNSGEYEVQLTERINSLDVHIHWNWFEEPDLMIILSKIKAVRMTYGRSKNIILNIPYFPYSRQDRVFQSGLSIPVQTIIDIFIDLGLNQIITYAFHGTYSKFDRGIQLDNRLTSLSRSDLCDYNHILPDINAGKHFFKSNKAFAFEKIRNTNGISLSLIGGREKFLRSLNGNRFLICDDILDGGRTFIECAKQLIPNFIIEVLVYHAFCTHGLDDLKKVGISKIKIINEDSYNAMIKKYPNDIDFFEYINILL